MLTSIFPKIPVLAMTVTATLKTKKDIANSIGLIDPVQIEEALTAQIFFSVHCQGLTEGMINLIIFYRDRLNGEL